MVPQGTSLLETVPSLNPPAAQEHVSVSTTLESPREVHGLALPTSRRTARSTAGHHSNVHHLPRPVVNQVDG